MEEGREQVPGEQDPNGEMRKKYTPFTSLSLSLDTIPYLELVN
jgi:hypothetical protein